MVIEEAQRLVKEKKIEEAIVLLRRQVELRGEDEEACWMELGIIYNSNAEFSQALNCFNAVLRLNSENTKARTYVNMINSILDYYCKDLLNP